VDIAHRVVVWQRNKRRRSTHKTKTRGEVKGTTRKARNQKGSGRARVGDLRAPQMRGGGISHGPVLRSFETGLPRKVRKFGLKVALSAKAAEGRIVILDSLHEGVVSKTKWLDSALDNLLGPQSLARGDHYHSVLCAEIPPTKEQGALSSKRKDTDRNDSGAGSGKMVPTWWGGAS
jgi:large subunit ribosomal protein L4